MKDFYFDMVARPRSHIWLRAASLALGVVAVAATVAYLQLVLKPQLAQQRQLVQSEMARLGTGKGSTTTMNARDLAQAWERAREVSAELTLPWQVLFRQLAQASKNGHVALMSIESESQKGTLALVAEARSMNDMLDYLKDLQSGPAFSDVTLQSHAINNTVPEKPVRFRLVATWRSTQ